MRKALSAGAGFLIRPVYSSIDSFSTFRGPERLADLTAIVEQLESTAVNISAYGSRLFPRSGTSNPAVSHLLDQKVRSAKSPAAALGRLQDGPQYYSLLVGTP